MSNHLPGLPPGFSETQTKNRIIQTLFQQLEKCFTRHAFFAGRNRKITSKLFFQNSINTLNLLFFTQLQTVFRVLFTSLPVLSRSITTTFKGTLFRFATGSL